VVVNRAENPAGRAAGEPGAARPGAGSTTGPAAETAARLAELPLPEDAEDFGGLDRQPLDATDLRLLSELAGLHDVHDPMPELLPDVVLFALEASEALGSADLDAEFARLVDSELTGAGLVGTRGVEHARRVTFASEHLTVMVVVHPQADGSSRIDGWAAPGGGLHIELRTGAQQLTTDCDETGRFVVDAVPAGPCQLVLHPTASSDPSVPTSVVTPAISL
jgi:hypothetical protein